MEQFIATGETLTQVARVLTKLGLATGSMLCASFFAYASFVAFRQGLRRRRGRGTPGKTLGNTGE